MWFLRWRSLNSAPVKYLWNLSLARVSKHRDFPFSYFQFSSTAFFLWILIFYASHCPFSFCGRCKNLIPLLLNSFTSWIFSSREKSQLWLIISGVTALIPQAWRRSRNVQLDPVFWFGKMRCVLCVGINMHYWMHFWNTKWPQCVRDGRTRHGRQKLL